MTEAQTFPEDIMVAARSVAMKIAAVLPVTGSEDVSHIAKAIFAERERCALIAEHEARDFAYGGYPEDIGMAGHGASTNIERAIRNPCPTPIHQPSPDYGDGLPF